MKIQQVQVKYLVAKPFIVLLGASIISCGGGGGGGSVEVPVGDLTGSWTVNETLVSDNCPDAEALPTYTVKVNQDGNTLFLSTNDFGGESFQGQVSASSVTWTGSFDHPFNDSRVTANAALTINSTCDGLSGTANWIAVYDGGRCNGITNVSASRIGGNGVCENGGGENSAREEAQAIIDNPTPLTGALPVTRNDSVSGFGITFGNGDNPAPVTIADLNNFDSGEIFNAYQFTPLQTGTYRLDLMTNSQDLNLYIFNAADGLRLNNRITATNQTRLRGNIDEFIELDLTQNTSYLVIITPYSIPAGSNGDYTLSIALQ